MTDCFGYGIIDYKTKGEITMKALDIIKHIKEDDIRGLLLKAEEELANEKAKAGGLVGVRKAVLRFLDKTFKHNTKNHRLALAGWFEDKGRRYILDGYVAVEVADGIELPADLKVEGLNMTNLLPSSDTTYTTYNNVAKVIKYLKEQVTIIKAERKANYDTNPHYSVDMEDKHYDAPLLITALECLAVTDTVEIGVAHNGMLYVRNERGNIGMVMGLKRDSEKPADIHLANMDN